MIRLTKDGNKVQNKNNNNSNGALDKNHKSSNSNNFMMKQSAAFGKSKLNTVRSKKGS
jgi:hypothetical protein